MSPLDLQVVQQAQAWLQAGNQVWLCTVLATYGSAPRGPGAMLVAMADGQWCGSLSGGCVEDDFLERLASGSFAPTNQLVRYGEGGHAPTLELPCGGVLDVLLESLTLQPTTLTRLQAMEAALRGAAPVVRRVELGGHDFSLEAAAEVGPRVLRDEHLVSVVVGPTRRLIIAGLSPVAEFCAQFASALGFEVVVCDPRIEQLPALVQGIAGVSFVPLLPAVYIAQGHCHGATAIVALTHDPRLDDLTLLEAVKTEAFYIGAMGSHRTSDKRRERLSRIGRLSAPELERVHAPIGLGLGSKTPAEIALAVMADILRVANGVARQAL